jgi:hypothetical protein
MLQLHDRTSWATSTSWARAIKEILDRAGTVITPELLEAETARLEAELGVVDLTGSIPRPHIFYRSRPSL